MLPAALKADCERSLSDHFKESMTITSSSGVGGGCINETAKLATNKGVFFLKWNDAKHYPKMFEAEANGLRLLGKSDVIKIPEVLLTGESDGISYIILEYIESGQRKVDFWEGFGRSLAALHQTTADEFGLDHDNYMGSLRQSNRMHSDWISFFVQERLEPQVNMALKSDKLGCSQVEEFEHIYIRLRDFFPKEPPALLHGDLWSGNFMVSNNGKACLIDPAVYYGHREIDLSMTHLFGGFDSVFYKAYQEVFPLEDGFAERIEIYNLYPLMVHLNLFGGSYLGSVEAILRRFSAR